jgi:hypothetical protein
VCYDPAMPGDWDFIAALRIARERIAAAAGKTVDDVEAAEGDHVARARSYIGMAAPALARLQMALTLGTSPEELDRVRGGARIMLESIKQAHAIVGLRAGEEVSVDLSDRMRGFLERWQANALPEAPEPQVLEHDPQEAERRVRGT